MWQSVALNNSTAMAAMNTHSVQNTFGMEVLETTENLACEGLRNLLIEFTMLAQTAGNGSTRNILQEAVNMR